MADLTLPLSIQSKFLDEAIHLLEPIHTTIEGAAESQRPLVERLYRLLLQAQRELEDD